MRDREKFSKKIYFFFGLFMICLYAAAGIILIFVWSPEGVLPDLNRIGLGLVLLIYAVYRFYRIFRTHEASKRSIEQHDQ